jgi:hypothetical protein
MPPLLCENLGDLVLNYDRVTSVYSHRNGCNVRTNSNALNRPSCASQQY